MDNRTDEHYDIALAAGKLDIAISTLYKLEREGKLTSIKGADGRRRYRRDEVNELAATYTTRKSARTKYTAWGQTKTIWRWSEDVRCQVSYRTLLRAFRRGERLEDVMIKDKWVAGFGEGEKPLKEWAEDPRCVVPLWMLRRRLKQGKPLEAALTTPIRPRMAHAT